MKKSHRILLSHLFFLLGVSLPSCIKAQKVMGMGGLLYVPTAENVEGGNFRVGANYIPKEALPAYFKNTYNSFNYYVDLNMFSFLEVCYRMTMLKGENGKLNQQDRSYTIKIQPISEGKYRPGFAIGITDPFNDGGVNSYESYYGVLTKGFELGKNKFSLSLGSFLNKKSDDARKKDFGTVFGGLSFEPSFCRNIKLIGEYDSKNFNAGVAVTVLKRFNINAFLYDMKNLSAGISYEYVLKH